MTRSKTGSTLGAKADMSEPTTQAGRALHQREHKGRSCPAAYGEDCWIAEDIAAIEAEARAEANATIAALREALERLIEHEEPDSAGHYDVWVDEARRVLADTAAAAEEARQRREPTTCEVCDRTVVADGRCKHHFRTRNYLDLASPEAERRVAEALTNLVFASSATRTERARAILAALREQS